VAVKIESNRFIEIRAVDAAPRVCQAAENFGPRQTERIARSH
jgi:hypothetical protein